MKIEQLLVQHLYDQKEVTLQGIGTFRLASDFVLPSDNDKDFVIPENALSFDYNKKAGEDEALISFIVQQTRKIRPLASADLDSYITLGKQFLNIGKPFRIEGIGTLQKNMAGEFTFAPGQFITPKLQEVPRPLKEKSEDDISFDTAAIERSSGNGKKILLIAAGIIGLGLIGWGAWYFLNKKKEPVTADTQKVQQQTTTKDTNTVSQAPKPDSLKPVVQTPAASGYTFKVVIKDYPNKLVAEQRYTKLSGYGHKLLLYSKDSATYKVAMPFTTPLSDTTRAKDSVRKKLFGGNPYIEL